jgi:dTDP-4-dehydrorhamnose reductase
MDGVELSAGLLDRDARVVFFSTDTVYGEQPEPFDESRPCRPLGVYAELKHEVERRFAAAPGFKTKRSSGSPAQTTPESPLKP